MRFIKSLRYHLKLMEAYLAWRISVTMPLRNSGLHGHPAIADTMVALMVGPTGAPFLIQKISSN